MAFLSSINNSGEKIRITRSAKAILTLLNNQNKPLPVKEIKNHLPYADRTIHYAVQQLKHLSLIESTYNINDMRERRYLLAAKAAYYGYNSFR